VIVQVVTFLCVLGMVIGQVLFKLSANSFNQTGSYFALKTILILFMTLFIYGITTLCWIWVLQKVELGRVYPLMALAFILVPLASHFIFGERFPPQYFFGVAMIISGVVLVIRAY
jgi:drug/metabolite transporter (DMT)-like permease